MVEVSFASVFPLVQKAATVHAALAIRRGLARSADREDLQQEVSIACWLALRKFDPTRASPRTYLERGCEESGNIRLAHFTAEPCRMPTHCGSRHSSRDRGSIDEGRRSADH